MVDIRRSTKREVKRRGRGLVIENITMYRSEKATREELQTFFLAAFQDLPGKSDFPTPTALTGNSRENHG